jgi:hypothetical protein
MLATHAVLLLHVVEFTVMPAPKLATLVPLTHDVYRPVSCTFMFTEPCGPVGEFTAEICGVPDVTVKPGSIAAVSPPVYRYTLYWPSVVLFGIVMFTVA